MQMWKNYAWQFSRENLNQKPTSHGMKKFKFQINFKFFKINLFRPFFYGLPFNLNHQSLKFPFHFTFLHTFPFFSSFLFIKSTLVSILIKTALKCPRRYFQSSIEVLNKFSKIHLFFLLKLTRAQKKSLRSWKSW